jgi:hypothetical protein
MNRFLRTLRGLALLSLMITTYSVSATNYTLWINGRSNASGVVGNYNSWNYWGPSTAAAGVNKKSVNWDGYNSIAAKCAMRWTVFAPAATGATSPPIVLAI